MLAPSVQAPKFKKESVVMRPVLLVVGTRPEGIKMIPVYLALKKEGIPTVVCLTNQHDQLLTEVFELFGVKPDYELKVMKPGQDLFYITSTVLDRIKAVFAEVDPTLVLVQGDTTTVMAAALGAFYNKIPVGHIEAGLRTGDKYAPYPEEANREIIGLLASYHFAPTATAAANLLAEGKSRATVFCTGNTVVDALVHIEQKIITGVIKPRADLEKAVAHCGMQGQKKILITAHRRESFDGGITRILKTVKKVAQERPDLFFFYPYHPNPAVKKAMQEADFHATENILLTEPVSYKDLVYLLLSVDMVATDSGGIQEEAVSLGKPVAVLREKSERMEGVWAGLATLVGTDEQALYNMLIMCPITGRHGIKSSIYGDGHAAENIVRIIQQQAGLLSGAYNSGALSKELQNSIRVTVRN